LFDCLFLFELLVYFLFYSLSARSSYRMAKMPETTFADLSLADKVTTYIHTYI